jgi:hypothetical protein
MNFLQNPDIADSETFRMLDDLKAFVKSEPWDFPFLDGLSTDTQSWEVPTIVNNGQQNLDIFKAPPEKVSQTPKSSTLKHKRSPSRKRLFSKIPGKLPSFKSSAVIYDAKGHKRGARIMNDLPKYRAEREGNRQIQRSEADNERARATLSVLARTTAALRYACGCKSPGGICNHHSFSCGLNLPDGVICDSCRDGAIIQVSKETNQPARLA